MMNCLYRNLTDNTFRSLQLETVQSFRYVLLRQILTRYFILLYFNIYTTSPNYDNKTDRLDSTYRYR